MSNFNQDKSIIRKKIKQKLKTLSIDEKALYSQQMQDHCIEFLSKHKLLNNKHIACYIPINHEIDCTNLIKILLEHGNLCYLPRINQNNNLDFFNYTLKDQLIKNNFGILEPKFEVRKKIEIQNLDLILMPILAFDLFGHRIGSGYGYYDRSLIINHQKINCLLIGLAYALQQVTEFIKDPWDIDLDVIITEKYVHSFF